MAVDRYYSTNPILPWDAETVISLIDLLLSSMFWILNIEGVFVQLL